MKLYIILPIYNEENSLSVLLGQIKEFISNSGTETKIIAVDDGSTDSSLAILKTESFSLDVKIIEHKPNKGIPGVFHSAFTYVNTVVQDGDMVVVMESDLTSDIKLLYVFIDLIKQGFDLVIGSRHVKGGGYINFPWYRTCGSSLVNLVLRLSWRIKFVHDYTIFYRAYSGALIKRFFEKGPLEFKSKKSFSVNGEILLMLRPWLNKVAEVPLKYDYGLKRGKSKMNTFGTLLGYLGLTIAYATDKE